MDWPGPEILRFVSNVWWVAGTVGAVLLLLLNAVFAFRVGGDATRRLHDKLPIAFGGPVLWFFATLIGSFFVVALYWLMHYSTLRREGDVLTG